MPSHDPEIYKDKIEVSLDGRQIFYLFFGGSVIVGLVFVLGVLVGRRVEARGHLDRADTQAVSDPLAALDRLERTDPLSFRGTLTGAQAPTDVEKAIGDLEKRRTAGAVTAAGKPEKLPAASPAPAEKPQPAAPAEKPQPAARTEPVTRPDAERPRADKHDGDKHDGDRRDGDKRDGDKHDGDRHDGDKHDGDKHDGDKKTRKHEDGSSETKKSASRSEPVTRPEAKADAKPDAKPEAKAEADAKVRFTLQLSSFQDRSEAEAFLGATKSAGFQAYLTEAEVTGKGTFYRVRLGSYRSLDAANDAKAEYEKTARKSAQVMRL